MSMKAATIYYFPASGRAELSRLIAAAGGIPMVEGGSSPDDRASFGSPGGLPLLQHGALKMAQSTAIENYLSLLAFPDLTPEQRTIDCMFCSIKEDVIIAYCKTFFGGPEAMAKKAETLPAGTYGTRNYTVTPVSRANRIGNYLIRVRLSPTKDAQWKIPLTRTSSGPILHGPVCGVHAPHTGELRGGN
jgi:hypothetical protein